MLRYKCWNCGMIWRSHAVEVEECPNCQSKPIVIRPNDIIEYEHHGSMMSVRNNLRGLHREYCLCWICEHFNPSDRTENCPIANKLFKICVDCNVVTPVWECARFKILQ